jgi:soluble lytic murein transglycosylase-like protein
LAALPAARAADQVTSYTVLSPDDVKTYGAIFAAQKTGQFAKADSLTAKLEDKSLLGYVLEDRYLGPHYRSKFVELKAWLDDYGDLAGADQIYKLALKRAPKKTPVSAPQRAHWRGAAGDGSAFGDMATQAHWTAGLAAYRLGRFENAAQHFEAVLGGASAQRTYSAAAFWAARSWTRTTQPERVLTLYERAASVPDTFYGLLATRVLGRDMNADFAEPALDTVSFAGLMLEKPAHRAVALWQIGHTEPLEAELSRAFGQMSPDLDPAFAALARNLGLPALELRAAETAAPTVKLTSLYPVPPYGPEGGYALDQAVVLAFAKQESRFQPTALSKAGARGVMQIMPQTAVTITHDRSLAGSNKQRLDDPIYSMTLGQNYLLDLIERQNGNLFSIAAAYNAGEGNLSKWQALQGDTDPLLFIETIPLAETRDYIKRVMANMWMYRRRLGQPTTGLDDAAAGGWPTYSQTDTVAPR